MYHRLLSVVHCGHAALNFIDLVTVRNAMLDKRQEIGGALTKSHVDISSQFFLCENGVYLVKQGKALFPPKLSNKHSRHLASGVACI